MNVRSQAATAKNVCAKREKVYFRRVFWSPFLRGCHRSRSRFGSSSKSFCSSSWLILMGDCWEPQRKYSAECIAPCICDVISFSLSMPSNILDVVCTFNAVEMRENVINIGLPTARQKHSKFPGMVPVSYGSCAVRPSQGSK